MILSSANVFTVTDGGVCAEIERFFPAERICYIVMLTSVPSDTISSLYGSIPAHVHLMLMTLCHVYLPCRSAHWSIAIRMEKGAVHDKNNSNVKPDRDRFCFMTPFQLKRRHVKMLFRLQHNLTGLHFWEISQREIITITVVQANQKWDNYFFNHTHINTKSYFSDGFTDKTIDCTLHNRNQCCTSSDQKGTPN